MKTTATDTYVENCKQLNMEVDTKSLIIMNLTDYIYDLQERVGLLEQRIKGLEEKADDPNKR